MQGAPTLAEIDKILRELNQDLKLGLDQSEDNAEALSQRPERVLTRKLSEDYQELTPRERLDVAIAYIQMDLFEPALEQLLILQKKATEGVEADASMALTAALLLVQVQFELGKTFDCLITLESILGDIALLPQDRVHFLYQMGRVYESLHKPEQARYWYKQVKAIDPGIATSPSVSRYETQSLTSFFSLG